VFDFVDGIDLLFIYFFIAFNPISLSLFISSLKN
jgi:hypothetical protein